MVPHSCENKAISAPSWAWAWAELGNIHPMARLREREVKLQADLLTVSKEITRLKINMKQASSNQFIVERFVL